VRDAPEVATTVVLDASALWRIASPVVRTAAS